MTPGVGLCSKEKQQRAAAVLRDTPNALRLGDKAPHDNGALGVAVQRQMRLLSAIRGGR